MFVIRGLLGKGEDSLSTIVGNLGRSYPEENIIVERWGAGNLVATDKIVRENSAQTLENNHKKIHESIEYF